MIKQFAILDKKFPLKDGEGTDAVHENPVYSYATTLLIDDCGLTGCGFAFTLGAGNDLVCKAAEFYAQKLVGKEIEDLMRHFGNLSYALSNNSQFRWLGPQKGIVHLALASVTNACFDLWAKKRKVPLWKLLTDLSTEEIINLLDLSYLEDVLSKHEAIEFLEQQKKNQLMRESILHLGYPGYDTSVGWFNYSDEKVIENCKKAIDKGFKAMKLKVGSTNSHRDIRRAHLIREIAGDDATIMFDANQQWTLPQAIDICTKLQPLNPFWIEEPTHPDDLAAHQKLAELLRPTKIAIGEHVPNKILFKNYLQKKAAGIIQVDATRVAGVSEFIAVSLLCKKYDIPVVPHVGDMGQLHQHLVLFNHISLGLEPLLLEYIPHLRDNFLHPATVEGGRYAVPQEPGSSCDFKE